MKTLLISSVVVLSLLFVSCQPEGWKMDYGKSQVQFEESALARKGEEYLGEKITITGVVESVDASDRSEAVVILEGGTQCHFGDLWKMAESCEVGTEVLIAGILKKDESGKFYLAPALLTSPDN